MTLFSFPGCASPRTGKSQGGRGLYRLLQDFGQRRGSAGFSDSPSESIQKLDDSRFLLTTTYNPNRPGLEEMTEEERAKELKKRKEERTTKSWKRFPTGATAPGLPEKTAPAFTSLMLPPANMSPLPPN